MVSPKVTLSAGLVLTLMSLSMVTGLATVNLGTSDNYAILAETKISNTGIPTTIIGNVGISPSAATYLTGFSLTLSSDGTYATSPRVPGTNKVYAASYASPTTSVLTTAIGDMVTAYLNASLRLNPDFLALEAGSLVNIILTPGLYKWNTPVTVGGIVTLSGSATDIFIFQITGTLNFSSGSQILLSGGALAQNVFWQVTGAVTCGTTSAPKGIILGKTGISFLTGASLTGRALAQTAVTLDSNAITQP